MYLCMHFGYDKVKNSTDNFVCTLEKTVKSLDYHNVSPQVFDLINITGSSSFS